MPHFARLVQAQDHSQHAAILIIHHNNKSGTIRGSSVFAATVDLLLSIQSPPDSDLIYLRPLKTREAAPQPITAQIHFNGDQFHLTQTNETPAFALAETTIKSEILAYLAKHGSATTPELMAWLSENNPGSVRNYVNYLLSTKQIRRVNIDKKGKPALFELTQNGETMNMVSPSLREPVPSEPVILQATREADFEPLCSESGRSNLHRLPFLCFDKSRFLSRTGVMSPLFPHMMMTPHSISLRVKPSRPVKHWCNAPSLPTHDDDNLGIKAFLILGTVRQSIGKINCLQTLHYPYNAAHRFESSPNSPFPIPLRYPSVWPRE